jgi:hypothetical protein
MTSLSCRAKPNGEKRFVNRTGTPRTLYSNCNITISGFDPNRNGGPQVPAPLEVKTCIFPIRLNPYTNCR